MAILLLIWADHFNVIRRITCDSFHISSKECNDVPRLAFTSNGMHVLRFRGCEYVKHSYGKKTTVYWRCRMWYGCCARLTTCLINGILTVTKAKRTKAHSCSKKMWRRSWKTSDALQNAIKNTQNSLKMRRFQWYCFIPLKLCDLHEKYCKYGHWINPARNVLL